MNSPMRIVLFACMFALASSCALAQAPGTYPWWNGAIAKDLGLSEEQTRQIRATVRDSRSLMNQLRAAVETAEAELKNAMNEDPVDVRKSNDAIEKVVKARADLMRAVSQMSVKLRLVLTAAQWQELQKRQPQRAIARSPLRRRSPAN
jgi:Spy/CpxP family protein refolding chaperone